MRLEYFTAPWCQPCKVFGPTIEKFAEENGYVLDKINIQDEPERLVPDVLGLPTVILYDGDNEVGRFTGAKSSEDLLYWVAEAGD